MGTALITDRGRSRKRPVKRDSGGIRLPDHLQAKMLPGGGASWLQTANSQMNPGIGTRACCGSQAQGALAQHINTGADLLPETPTKG